VRALLLLVVALALAGCTSTGPRAGPNEILALSDASHGDRFEPATRTVQVGDTITFRVVGSTPHTVDFGMDTRSAVPGVSQAHSGNLAGGDAFAVTFTQPGTYDYFCQYHLPGMTGTITVR
jgi:plastocyanin